MDAVLVRSNQLGIYNGRQTELPLYGQVSIRSFLHQVLPTFLHHQLRTGVRTRDLQVISQAETFTILAIVQYVKIRPFTVSISAKGIVGEERMYEERVHLKRTPCIGQIVDAEVIALPSKKLEYEAEFQNVLYTYCLPIAFQELEEGGHLSGIHRVWVRYIRESSQTNRQGNIIQRVKMSGKQHPEQIREYEGLITASAVYAKERIRTNFWISRACPTGV